MPLYEYACLECGNRFELLRGVQQSHGETVCERCSGSRVKRLLSVFAAPRTAGQDVVEDDAYAGGGCACGGACSCRN